MAYQLNIDWPAFLATYWQKKPVLLRKALPGFIDPITPDELAGLAMESEIDSRLVSCKEGRWQASNGPFNHFDHLGERDWSLLVQAVNHWHAPSAQLVMPFRVLPDWRLDDLMVSFSVPGGGVGPHIDNYDVFIIQGMGRRRWRVGDALPLRQFCSHPALLHVEPFTPIIDEELTAGDILYIPPGFPHDGLTHESALNYSVGFRGPNARDLISNFADYVLEYDLGGNHYSDPDLTLRDNVSKVEEYELTRLRTMMLTLIDDPDTFHQWFGRFASTPRHELDIAPAQPPYQQQEIVDALIRGERLKRLSGLRVLQVGDSFFVNSEALNTRNRRGAEALCRHLELSGEHFGPALQDAAFMALLCELVNSGYWYFTG